MDTIYIILMILGAIMCYAGIISLDKKEAAEPRLYCDELGYIASLKDWKKYARSLTDSKPIQNEITLMDREQFMREMAVIFKLTMREV